MTYVLRQIIISIHPTRGATPHFDSGDARSSISIHAPHGSDLREGANVPFPIIFHSTPPHGSDRCERSSIKPPFNISIHAPTRERLEWITDSGLQKYISIHAPTRGATPNVWQAGSQPRYFNPRPHTGSDKQAATQPTPEPVFQSTPPHGERPCGVSQTLTILRISIHAPTRGATPYTTEHTKRLTNFNPRPHTGSDLTIPDRRSPSYRFQSTPPHGERRDLIEYSESSAHFNPRPHTGSDLLPAPTGQPGDISIHAPTRGATIATWLPPTKLDISIHAPTRGATSPIDARTPLLTISIHAPTRGATRTKTATWPHCRFQSTPPHGERRNRTGNSLVLDLFQSTPPHGERQEAQTLMGFPEISIHAPTRGATLRGARRPNQQSISIHAPTRGATTCTWRLECVP